MALPYRTALVSLSCAYWCIQLSDLRAAQVFGESMSPTLHDGDLLLCSMSLNWNKLAKQKGALLNEIAIIRSPSTPGRLLVKRIIAMPGDPLPRHLPNRKHPFRKGPSGVVPKGYCFVAGDNVRGSMDSRFFGPVPLNLVEGILLYHWKRSALHKKQEFMEDQSVKEDQS